MYASRIATRSARAVRVNSPALKRNARFASDNAGASSSTGGAFGPGMVGGLAGGSAVLLGGYLWYSTSGVKTAVQTAREYKSYVDSTTDSLKVKFQEMTPESSEILNALKDQANKYARFIPGGTGYVDKVFKDIDIIRNKHGDEVDQILREAYGELRDTSKKGMTLDTASQSWEILSKYMQRLASLSADAAQDILDNHPEIKNRLGGSFDQLKQLGDQIGPEAKKQVDETWGQVSDIVKQGVQWNTLDRIRKLIQEKTQQLQKMGEQAWQKGYEQVKPMLEKNPQIKKIVDENQDLLKTGNAGEAVKRIQEAISSGNTGDLEKYVKMAKDKSQQYTSMSSSSLSDWLEMVPMGSQIMPLLSKLKDVAQQEGPKAEALLKDTMNDIMAVLEKRKGEVEELAKNAEKKTKN